MTSKTPAQRILSVLDAAGRPLSVAELAREVGRDPSTVHVHLAPMVAGRQLRRERGPRGPRGGPAPWLYERLPVAARPARPTATPRQIDAARDAVIEAARAVVAADEFASIYPGTEYRVGGAVDELFTALADYDDLAEVRILR